MKRALLAALAIVAIAGTGCHQLQRKSAIGGDCPSCNTCKTCGVGGHSKHGSGHHGLGKIGLAKHGHGSHGHAGPGMHGGGGRPPLPGHEGHSIHGHYPYEYAKRRPGHPDYVPKLPLHHGRFVQSGPPGPPAPAYAYPYYTTRGPRDFLLDNPPTIGR